MRRAIPASLIVVGLSLLYPLQRWIDHSMPREVITEERLYFSSGETIRKMSLGLHSLVAEIYWIRTVQYFGRKLLDTSGPFTGDTRNIRMDLLAPLLNIVVTLDPQHIPAYRFGAIFLPERDLAAAIALLERGVRENPQAWRLYQDLGYINWKASDYLKASEWYERGSQISGVPSWMGDLAGLMKIKGGERKTAQQIYEGYLSSDDPNIRAQAAARLKQLRMLDEIDAINNLLALYKEQTGTCLASLRLLAAKLRSAGLRLDQNSQPIDPDGFPYVLDSAKCQASQAFESPIPR